MRSERVIAGRPVQRDLTGGATIFSDPDGDPLTYSVTFEPEPVEAFLNTFTDDALLNDPKFSDPL